MERHNKVVRFAIHKPTNMSWGELDRLLQGVRYRVFRLANLVVGNALLRFHARRTGQTFEKESIGQTNRRLRQMLVDEEEEVDRFAKTGAVITYVCDALAQSKIRAVTAKSKWSEVLKGHAALPSFKRTMAIPIRCDKPENRRLVRTEDGEVAVDLLICNAPYPRVILKTAKLNDGQRAILDRLLANSEQSLEGYRQRMFEIKQDRNKKWWVYVTYDFPASKSNLDQGVIVGVDLGYTCPLYAAISNGHERLGWNDFACVAHRIKSLQTQVMARRRQILRGGRSHLVADTARSGHGRKRHLLPMERLEGKIHDAYSTLNHQLSKGVVEFAKKHGAGTIQIEDLDGLRETLSGTFIGERWRYHQLQTQLAYKAQEAGIQVRKVNPKYTSRRCSKCGYIHLKFDREYRAKNNRFVCPQCAYDEHPDYNAAKNLTLPDIADRIKAQLSLQEDEVAQAADGQPVCPES